MSRPSVEKLLACGSRLRILAALMDGRPLPASELAVQARVSNPTASGHLKALEAAGLIDGQRRGRHRFYALTSMSLSPAVASRIDRVSCSVAKPDVPASEPTGCGRLCYDHLAGRLGTAITTFMIAAEALLNAERGYSVASDDHVFFVKLGIDLKAVTKKRRHLAPRCIDWGETEPHVGGALGAEIADRFFELGWISRGADDRSVELTDAGVRGLRDKLGIDLKGLAVPTSDVDQT